MKESMNKLIDILVPYYKGDFKLLKRLLDSIASQKKISFDLLNLIILNDDYDYAELENFRKQSKYPFNIQLIARKHSGISATRNDLLSQAKANYVMFCDQDDYFIDDLVLSKYAYIIKKESYGTAPDVIISPIKHININQKVKISSPNANNIQGTLLHGRAFRTAFLKDNNILFLPCLDGMEDYYFVNLALQLSKKTACIEGKPTYCWANDNSSSVSNSLGEGWVIKNFDTLILGNSLITRELINRGISKAVDTTVVSFLLTTYQILHNKYNSGFIANNKELSDYIKLNLYFYILEFEKYIRSINQEKLNTIYTKFKINTGINVDQKILISWINSIKRDVQSLPKFRTKNSFSIIIATHNRRDMLVKALDSVIAQKYPNYEIVLCDDHSIDDTEAYVKHKYKKLIADGILKYIKSEGTGAHGARNTALKYATKPWIAYLDDDNVQQINFLHMFNYMINSYPEYTCFYARWINMFNKARYIQNTNFDYESLKKGNYIDLGVFVHKANLYYKYGGFDSNLNALEDWDLILKYTANEKTKGFKAMVLDYYDGDHPRITNSGKFYDNFFKIRKKFIGDNLPEVTTLVVCYNQVDYISQALDSAISQEGLFKHKILISDDGSTDGTKEIIRKYANKYPNLIKIISPRKHLGVTANYWHALSKVNTKYVAILEGDDYWHDYKLFKCIDRLEEDDKLGLVFNEVELLKYSTNDITSKSIFKTGSQNIVLTEKDLINCPGNNFFINLSSCVFRTELINMVPEYLKTDYVFSEIPMQFFITNKGFNIGRIPEALSTYRIHQNGVWSGASEAERAKLYYDTRRAAFEAASIAGKKHLYPILKAKQDILLENSLITQNDIDKLDNEYFELPGTKVLKGIILAGGTGSRLYPVTLGVNKNLLPVYDKPLVYYSLSILMLAGIKDILIISNPEYLDSFKHLLNDGSQFGINIEYAAQYQANGIAEAFTIGKEFIGTNDVALILGDNIFYGADIVNHFNNAIETLTTNKASIYAYHVKEPERFGIVELDEDNQPVGIEEKPKEPKSNYCVTGLYFYPNDVIKFAETLKPSERGELEITDINKIYLDQKRLNVELLGRGYAWFDTGKPEALLQASNFISAVQENENLVVACPEEIAYTNGWIDKEQLMNSYEKMKITSYGKHILKVIENKIKH